MLLVRPNRKSTSGWVSCHIAFICLTALGIVLARSAPLNFTHTPPPNFRHASLSPAGHSHASSERRQCFDREDSPGVSSLPAALIAPPPVFSLSPVPTPEPPSEFETDGVHYNRPPPVS